MGATPHIHHSSIINIKISAKYRNFTIYNGRILAKGILDTSKCQGLINIKQNYTKQSFSQLRHNKKGKDKYPVVGPPHSMLGHHKDKYVLGPCHIRW